MTTYEVVNKYIDEAEILLAKSTAKTYQSILTEFARTCGERQPDRSIVIEHIKKLKERGNSNNTIRSKLTAIKIFVRWATENEYYEHDFAGGVPLPSPEYHIAERMTKDEVHEMLRMEAPKHSHNVERDKALIELAIVTASRVSAITQLKRSDVDLVNKTVRFRHTKRNKELVLPLTDALCDALKSYIDHVRPKELTDNDYLFVGERKIAGAYKPLTRQAIFNISKRYTEAACGKALSPHKLRHTSASLQLESGLLSMDEISKNLGHSSISTTQRYAQRLNDNGRRAATVAVFEGL